MPAQTSFKEPSGPGVFGAPFNSLIVFSNAAIIKNAEIMIAARI